jgi:glycine betaine transporter
MSTIVETFGSYAAGFLPHGFKTFTFAEWEGKEWFKTWTLNYIVWWLAWAPFVGVFIARISRGRTIREFVSMVIIVPTLYSLCWFGIFGGIAFHEVLLEKAAILDVVQNDVNSTVFYVLAMLPLSKITISATILVAFLFIVTSVVSAGFALGMFSTHGDLNPSTKVKLIWGVILGALGLVMVLTDSIMAVRAIIALGAMPFIFIILLLLVCLLKDLKKEFK